MKTMQKLLMLLRKHNRILLIFLVVNFLVSCNSDNDENANLKVQHFYDQNREQIEEFIKYTKNINIEDSSVVFKYLPKSNPHLQAFKSDGRKTKFVVAQNFEFFFSSNDIVYFYVKDSLQSFYFYKIRNRKLNGLELIHFEKPLVEMEGDSINGIVVLVKNKPKPDESYYYKIDEHWYIFSKK